MIKSDNNSNNFYRSIAAYYDKMTRFEQRLDSEKVIISEWMKRYNFNRVLDTACGTGLYAIICASLGADVTGADPSVEMLSRAALYAEKHHVKVRWVNSTMQEIDHYIQTKFPMVICLGNSLPHLLTKADLVKSIDNFYRLLEPRGKAVIQLLNYSKILKQQNRIIGIQKSDDHEFIRFYDFYENLIRFNVLQVHWENGKPYHYLASTHLYPYTWREIKSHLEKIGFTNFKLYGDMTFSPFQEADSPNLVIVAQKN